MPEKKFIMLLFCISGGYILIFYITPLYGLTLGFKNFSFALGINSPWNGLDNFKYLFSDKIFLKVLFNTIRIGFYRAALLISGSFFISLVLSHVKSKKALLNIMFIILLPQFLSWIVISCVFRGIFAQEGIIGALTGNHLLFYTDEKLFPMVLYSALFWRDSGLIILLLTHALKSVDREIIEAGKLDGAGSLRILCKLQWPIIKQQIQTIIIFVLIGFSSGAFEAIFNFYNPGLYEHFDIMDTYIYRVGIATGKIAIGTSLEIIKTLLNLVILSFILIRITRAMDKFNPFSLLNTEVSGKMPVWMKIATTIITSFYLFPFLVLLLYSFSCRNWFGLLNREYWNALLISLASSTCGAFLSSLLSLFLAYAMYWLYYSKKRFKKNYIPLLTRSLFFLLLINGGIISMYILVGNLKIQNSFFALFIPYLMNFIFILYYLEELKKVDLVFVDMLHIDGATPLHIFLQINFGIKRTALINMFIIYFITHWNNWYAGVLFIDKKNLFPVNVFLRNIIAFDANINNTGITTAYYNLNQKMFMAFFSIIPLLILVFFLNYQNIRLNFRRRNQL